jgi:hypothetical protein
MGMPVPAGVPNHNPRKEIYMTDPTTSTIEGQLITTEEYVELTEGGEETEEEQIQLAAEEEKPAPVEVKPLPVLLIEDDPYDRQSCQITVSFSFLPGDGNPKGRNVVITAHSHNDAPIITMKRAGDIEDYGTEIQTMMNQVFDGFEENKAKHETRKQKREKEEKEAAERAAKMKTTKPATATLAKPATPAAPAKPAPVAKPAPKQTPAAAQLSLF